MLICLDLLTWCVDVVGLSMSCLCAMALLICFGGVGLHSVLLVRIFGFVGVICSLVVWFDFVGLN